MNRIDFLPNHPEIKLYQNDKCIKINTDTEVLGEFIEVYKNDSVLDIGTNSGALLLYANRFNPKELIGIDINEDALMLCKENMILNNINNYTLINCDAMTYCNKEVDVIICNPPYFKTEESNKCKSDSLSLAKHESGFTIEGLLNTVNKNLKLNGTLFMLFQTPRLSEVITLLNKYHLEIKILQFVYDNNKEFSNVFMIKAIKCGKPGLNVIKPKIIKRK